jgi:hypothetical protein
VRVTRYEVSCVPRDNINARGYVITVDHKRDDLWAAGDGVHCLNEAGEWVVDPSGVYNRHDEKTALRLARQAAPSMTCMGYTVADALAGRTRRETTGALVDEPGAGKTTGETSDAR